jgi:hypothetical protein
MISRIDSSVFMTPLPLRTQMVYELGEFPSIREIYERWSFRATFDEMTDNSQSEGEPRFHLLV